MIKLFSVVAALGAVACASPLVQQTADDTADFLQLAETGSHSVTHELQKLHEEVNAQIASAAKLRNGRHGHHHAQVKKDEKQGAKPEAKKEPKK